MAVKLKHKEHEMKQGLSRFRRMATAGAAGAIALSFLSVLGVATPASADLADPVGTTLAASAPTIIQGWSISPPATGRSLSVQAPPAGYHAQSLTSTKRPVQSALTSNPRWRPPQRRVTPDLPHRCRHHGNSPGGHLTIPYTDTAATTVPQIITISNVATTPSVRALLLGRLSSLGLLPMQDTVLFRDWQATSRRRPLPLTACPPRTVLLPPMLRSRLQPSPSCLPIALRSSRRAPPLPEVFGQSL